MYYFCNSKVCVCWGLGVGVGWGVEAPAAWTLHAERGQRGSP